MSQQGAGRLAGKVAIVAGAGSQGEGAGIGTGRATAVLFAREGARPRGLTGYSEAKGAVIALTRAMAVDHGAQGIRVNCIVPGPLYTPMAVATG